MLVGILDYGVGNVGSVVQAFKAIGVQSVIPSSDDDLTRLTHLVLPGVGSFDYAVSKLRAYPLFEQMISLVVSRRVMLLGICVGAQILGHSSEEGGCRGLSLVDMKCKRLPASQIQRVPHVGWQALELVKNNTSILFDKEVLGGRVYFTHSYYFSNLSDDIVLSRTTYGLTFVSSYIIKNIIGVQFHPEKSQKAGLAFLKSFTLTYAD
jgi:glutamine amidotransferase